jgi:hypothetical protein
MYAAPVATISNSAAAEIVGSEDDRGEREALAVQEIMEVARDADDCHERIGSMLLGITEAFASACRR